MPTKPSPVVREAWDSSLRPPWMAILMVEEVMPGVRSR